MSKSYLSLSFVCCLAFIIWGCSDDDEPGVQFELTGQWEHVFTQGQGKTELLLDINQDSSFVWTITTFGLQPGTAPDEKNGFIEYPGILNVNQNDIEFVVDEYTYTDFYFDIGPDTYKNMTKIYDKCSYQISVDTLILSYTSYPADAPVASEQRYVRVP